MKYITSIIVLIFSLSCEAQTGENIITDYPLQGEPTGSYTHGSFTYSSTIDVYTDLYAKYAYDAGYTNLPLRVVMHGWSQDADNISQATMEDVASYRYFVLAVGMRGRDGASGSRDVSARELYDIYDAIQYVRSNYSFVNVDNMSIAGYSGGGGNVLGFLCKFPDLPVMAVDICGPSDYAYGDSSWQAQGWNTGITLGSDAAYARDATQAIDNYEILSRPLFMFHGELDPTVRKYHSTMIVNAFTGEDYTELAGVGHLAGFPYEDYYRNDGINIKPLTISSSGTFVVIGYLKTSLFEIWLGDGTEEVANLTYDVGADSYTFAPQTGSMTVTVTQYDGKTGSDTFSTTTEIVVE